MTALQALPRVLGEMGPDGPGPTLVVVCGLHGNEPAGVLGATRVLEALEPRAAELRGRLVVLVGNRGALAKGERFLDRDLNRAWTPERLRHLRSLPAETPFDAEDREQLDLLAHLDRVMAESDGPVYALDLHTTSGPRGVFTTVGDTLENRTLAQLLPVPLVLGLEELVEGTLHDYLGERGVVTLAFECGQHVEAEAPDRAEAAIWTLVAGVGLLPESRIPELSEARKRLSRTGKGVPRVVELRYRHPAPPEAGFTMRPGFATFTPVRRGDPVADDARGPIPVPESGRLLMPLYQRQGEDGFFLVREFRVFWLHLSRVLRTLGVDRWVHHLPGIREDPMRPEVLVVNRRVARWYALQLLHLLGFRRHRVEGDLLVVIRRPPPAMGPH